MEVGSVWKLTGNAAMFLEQNNIDSTKIHFLSGGVFLITYENNSNQYTETSTWTEPSNGSIDFTYDPSGFFFGQNCPTENTTFDYAVVSNSFTMQNIGGTCSIASGLLNNSTWQKQGTANVFEYGNVDFNVYPNPATSNFFLTSSQVIDFSKVKLYNLLGQEQKLVSQTLSAHSMSIDVSGLVKGWYFINYNSQFKIRVEVR